MKKVHEKEWIFRMSGGFAQAGAARALEYLGDLT